MNDVTMVLGVGIAVLLIITLSLFSYLLSLRQIVAEKNSELDMVEVKFENLQLEFSEEKRLAIEYAIKRSRTSQRNQIKGTLGERFTPFMGGFPYNPSDCRFLGEPVDFIIFNNLHECSDGVVPIEEVEIIIADVKTGNARLSQRQKILQYAIDNGQVRFETFRVSDSTDKPNNATSAVNALKVDIE